MTQRQPTDTARENALEVELEAFGVDLAHAERGLLHYEAALTRIESFSVDDNNHVALRMGEIARVALGDRTPWRDNDEDPAEALARRFHETYERLAPTYGYKTREESAVPWEQVPENNRRLMVAVCQEILIPDDGPRTASWLCPVCGETLDRADGSVDAHCAGSKLEGTAHERTRMVAA